MSLRSPSGWMNATDVRSSRTENFLHSCCSTTQQHVFYVQSSVDGVTISVKLWNLSNLHNDKKTQCLKTNIMVSYPEKRYIAVKGFIEDDFSISDHRLLDSFSLISMPRKTCLAGEITSSSVLHPL